MEAWWRSFWLRSIVVCIVCGSASAKYENFTVGDTEGWTANASLSYTKWASDKKFSLGDFLIFRSVKPEYDVIHTYNKTVYTTCDYLDGNGDFEVWGEPGTTTVSAVPLVETGPNYFFCGANDSLLCKAGMKFSINVTEGDGLPPSLATPPPGPANATTPSHPSSPSGDGNGAPYQGPFSLFFLVPLIAASFLAPLHSCGEDTGSLVSPIRAL